MKSHVRAAVIGGGVVGASVLYHLTKAGWKDVVLLERDELTSGSTWHAAGGFHALNGDPNVAKLQAYTMRLYEEIEEISGQSCGRHVSGGMLLADTPDRLEWLKNQVAIGRYQDMDLEIIDTAEAKRRLPLIDEQYFCGALYDPAHGHLDPSGTTHAYAKSARINGAEIYRQTMVKDLQQRPDGSWDVITDKGTIVAEHVVNAGGLWAREVGRMVGLELPVLAMSHHYVLTDDMPEVEEINRETGGEILHAIDFGGEIYMRQERRGMLLGTYEQACVPWSPKETPWDFGQELLEPDLDRIAPSLEIGFKHFPAFQKAGIREIINGPFTFAPDGNPLVGPVRGLRNYWCACGVMAGFSQGGGVGLTLANWMTDGDPGFDIFAMDVARYGDWATLSYTNKKVRENYSRRFRIRFPNEELPAARPHRTTPIYDLLKDEGAVFGDSWGMEVPLWFAKNGEEDVFSFHRSTDFDSVGRECRAVRETAGLTELSSFAKYEVKGPGAEGFLYHIMANRMPKTGRMVLSPMLNENGKLVGEFTIAKPGDERFLLIGSGVGQEYHMRWFEQHMPKDGSVSVRAFGLELCGLSIAGPKAREILQSVAGEDISNEAFKFMAVREMDVASVPAIVGRVTYTGDLGYEIWVKAEYLRQLYLALMEAGKPEGMKLFGSRAILSLRLEKNFGTWIREFRPIYGAFEAGLGRFVDLKKNDFIGRDAAKREHDEGPQLRRVTLDIDATDADVIGDEPVWHDGKVVGWVTSGGYSHWLEKSLATGYVPANLGDGSSKGQFEVEILGDRRKAELVAEPLFDPQAERMRG